MLEPTDQSSAIMKRANFKVDVHHHVESCAMLLKSKLPQKTARAGRTNTGSVQYRKNMNLGQLRQRNEALKKKTNRSMAVADSEKHIL